MKSRTRSLIAITVIPVALIGALLWWAAGLVPECSNTVLSTLVSPDAGKALVVFARDCGGAGLNSQAVIMTPGRGAPLCPPPPGVGGGGGRPPPPTPAGTPMEISK